MAARKSALLTEVLPTEADSTVEITANAGLSLVEGRADRVDPFAMAMDRALGLEATRPFTTLSRWNTHAVDFAWSVAPVVYDLFSLAVKACVELQLNWLSWIPGWQLGIGPDGSADLEDDEQRRMTLAESMDIATGAQPAQPASAPAAYAAAVGASMGAAASSGQHTAVQAAGSYAEASIGNGGMR